MEKVDDGYRAVSELRRISDGVLLATAEGYVCFDELTWFGGVDKGGKVWPKRPDFAIKCMCQTRAISRVCRSAFAHVVVLIDSDLSTTPAEEMPIDATETDRPVASSVPKPPFRYDQELELVNRELEEAAQRKRNKP